MKKTDKNFATVSKIEKLQEASLWAGDNTSRLIYALIRIAEDPTNAKNVARNVLDDVGLRIDYEDEND